MLEDILMLSERQKALWKLAEKAASYEVDAFIAHDKHDYSKTEENFYLSLRLMLPWYDDSVLKEVARERAEVLRCHDEIEEAKISKSEKLKHPKWRKEVFKHARNEAQLLGIKVVYASNKTQFYRLHGQGVSKFRHYVYEMDRHFTTGITGDSELHVITAPIYLTCIAFHDLRRNSGKQAHDCFSKRMMQMNYANYVFNLLHAIHGKRKILF